MADNTGLKKWAPSRFFLLPNFSDWKGEMNGQEMLRVIDSLQRDRGIDKNIMDCYRFIVQNYSLGDELYFFGFSRGAFTARSLAGMIGYLGILDHQHCHTDSELKAYVKHAYRTYRRSQRAYLEIILGWIFLGPWLSFQRKFAGKTHLVDRAQFKEKFSIKHVASNSFY